MIVVGSPTEEAQPAGSPTSPADDGMDGTNNAHRVNWEAWEHFMYKALVLPYATYTRTATVPPAQTRPLLPRSPGARIVHGKVDWARVQAYTDNNMFSQEEFLAADTILLFVDNRLMDKIEWWPPVARLAQERTAFRKVEMES